MPGDEQAPDPNPNPNPKPNPHRPESTGVKRRRNLPGTPAFLFPLSQIHPADLLVTTDPEAEVVALSPRTLTTANTYPCDVCGKEFRRHQNLQIHQRGHNLPWKLKASGEKDRRKRVYVCPVETCVYHNPSRALGDLTGIKKHYCRKHGERKWNCERCPKSYAVRTDWKAHSRICGSRRRRHDECRCGASFSRKESFVMHKASCGGEGDDGCALSLSLASTAESGLKMNNAAGAGGGWCSTGEHCEPVRAHPK